MWSKVRASTIKRDEKEYECKTLNVKEEYFHALRTKSYADFFSKAQSIMNSRSFTPTCHLKFSEILLEPDQELVPEILESTLLSKVPKLKNIMLNYFELSAEASKMCIHLLNNINQVRSNYYTFIQQLIDGVNDENFIINRTYLIENNPFSAPNKDEFNVIHDRYTSMLHNIKSKRKNLAKRLKFVACINRASGVCVTTICALIAIAIIILSIHSLSALVMGPIVIYGFRLNRIKKKIISFKLVKSELLKRNGQQLEVAAKGTYILKRDFDTISRLVIRLHEEVEHNKALIQLCLDRRENVDGKFSMEVVKEIVRNDDGFKKKVKELEEHLYLCLLTINRTRCLVVKEITSCIN